MFKVLILSSIDPQIVAWYDSIFFDPMTTKRAASLAKRGRLRWEWASSSTPWSCPWLGGGFEYFYFEPLPRTIEPYWTHWLMTCHTNWQSLLLYVYLICSFLHLGQFSTSTVSHRFPGEHLDRWTFVRSFGPPSLDPSLPPGGTAKWVVRLSRAGFGSWGERWARGFEKGGSAWFSVVQRMFCWSPQDKTPYMGGRKMENS